MRSIDFIASTVWTPHRRPSIRSDCVERQTPESHHLTGEFGHYSERKKFEKLKGKDQPSGLFTRESGRYITAGEHLHRPDNVQ